MALVPWNASWTGEDRYEVRPCRWCDGMPAMWQPHAPTSGRPIFAKPHSVRQRWSVAALRCTVCGEPTEAGDRWWFGLGSQIKEGFSTTEAPVHGTCAGRALDHCPHLRKLDRSPRRFPSGWKKIASIIGGPQVKSDYGLDIAPGRIVVGHLKFCWVGQSERDLWRP